MPLGRITISNPQNVVKDCYASSPKIDLTLRANGEEAVMVMDSLGNWTPAGFVPPSGPASISTGSAGTFIANMYWSYQYVYVAKVNYPLVENSQTGGGSVAPRSNPSPVTAADSTVNTNKKVLAIPTSQRGDISHIWIYRTTFFDNAQEAADFAAAGNIFWIGEVLNNPNLATVPFTDDASIEPIEQIENDNFAAPQFDKAVYADPYFWGFGNAILEIPVTLNSTGGVIVTSGKWYDGRNAQTISFVGITTGGYDSHGSFYFKAIDNTNAQLYSDIALQNPVGPDAVGDTVATIRGASTVLYRSKTRNPFSWGQTDLIGDTQVPAPYQFSVGGGIGTAIAVIPNQNLLKLDTEAPNKCYTLNLKNAGTPNFEPSLRIISDSYSISNQHSQFPATLDRGQNVLWGIDNKSFTIVECDGSGQVPTSNFVYKTLRQLSLDSTDRLYFHGVYCPRLELNCIFIKTQGSLQDNINKCVFQHGPTGLWGTLDILDVLCSGQVFDSDSGQLKIMVGTETGYVGEMFADGLFHNWFQVGIERHGRINYGFGTATYTGVSAFTVPTGNAWFLVNPATGDLIPGVLNNWVMIIPDFAIDAKRYLCQIVGVIDGGQTFQVGTVLVPDDQAGGEWRVDALPGGLTTVKFYIGLIEMQIARSFNGQVPFDYKKILEYWTSWRYKTSDDAFPITQTEVPTIEWFGTFCPEVFLYQNEVALVTANNSIATTSVDGLYSAQTKIPIDQAKVFSVILRDRNFCQSQLVNYEIRLSPTASNGRNN